MATIKSYTDIEQSKKLAKILPLKSADMYYDDIIDSVTGELFIPADGSTIKIGKGLGGSITAWSLAALLSIFECYEINKFGNNIQFYAKGIALSTKENETILDIVVDTIILLHKQNLL